jgi:hypothetical protein
VRLRYRRSPQDARGIEESKVALYVAKAIEEHATRLAQEHREILRRNNLAGKIHNALGGH